ncbi:MAG TPA: diguanylate cyclase, partial [Burkholderiaceae bacterium]|nr:diguanylate cyclase [Burkholderiaceae bacterium]
MNTRPMDLEDAGGAPPRVLLVDDDPVNLMLTAAALRDRGFEIVEVEGGQQALDGLDAVAPDLVVLDAMMPEPDGFETCRRLRARAGYSQLPVLMLTGLDDDASIERAYRAGATDFFVKSTQWSLLTGRLRYMLRASRTRNELERSKFKLARAQDLARMGSFDWQRNRGMGQLWLSPEALRVLGRHPNDRVDVRALLRMVGAGQRRGLMRMLSDVAAHNAVLATDVQVTLFDGRARIIHVEAEAEFEHGHSVGYTGVFQDVTDRRVAEDRIRHLANFDSLTGLPNRRQLIWRTERALEHARRLGHNAALLLIDLDRFKNVNDTLGHAAGDELLMEVSRRLRACVRHSEQVMEGALEAAGARSHRSLEAVGRLGGDEFVALLPEVSDDADAQRVANRILDSLRDPVMVAGQECFVTASVGIAMFPRDGLNLVDLMRNSDVAMYAAKSAGRNSAQSYSPHLGGRGREKIELESHLHKAIERNELVLHYQPKIDVRGARMVGAEALMRWQRGNQLVPPGDFIPLAEETGLIVPLSEWAIREASRQARVWRDAFGFDQWISVNLPSRMFERSDLVETIHEAAT